MILVVSSLFVSFLLAAYLSSDKTLLRLLDHPNARSLHQHPIPRTGGLAICAGIMVGWLVNYPLLQIQQGMAWIVFATLLICVISLLDDWRNLSIWPRLAVQLCAACCLLPAGLIPIFSAPDLLGAQFLEVLLILITLLGVMWMTNLYNFMDGIDGFAAGMAVIGFATMTLLGMQAQDKLFSLFTASIALAAVGFLYFNFPPARLFMGDTGSSVLGFLAAVAILWAHQASIFPLWMGILIFSLFIVDATITLLLRMIAKKQWWQAHREHAYQRLVRLGWGHRRTTLIGYVLMTSTSATVLLLSLHPSSAYMWIALTLWLIIYLLIAISIWHVWAQAKDNLTT